MRSVDRSRPGALHNVAHQSAGEAKTRAAEPRPFARLFGAHTRLGVPADAARNWVSAVGRLGVTDGPNRNVIHELKDRAGFDTLSDNATGAGAAGMPEVKFLIDRETHQLYFIPKEFEYHYSFASNVLGVKEDVEAFNRESYLSPDRHYIAGTLTAYDNYEAQDGKKGLFGMSFWSTDIVRGPMLLEAYDAIKAALPFGADKLVYHPGGQTQERLIDQDDGADRKALEARGIPILSNTDLSARFSFMALNQGKAFGTLRVVHGDGEGQLLTRRDIAIYADDVPAEIPPLAALATPKPQTYLSHDALKARQDHTPYAYARDILADPAVKALEGKVVSIEVKADGYEIKEATQEEADQYFESLRPKEKQELKPDLDVQVIRSLDDIAFKDARAFGTKTTNVAEMHKLQESGLLNVSDPDLGEPEVVTPDGFGIPAWFYAEFMGKAKYSADKTFNDRLDEMVADPKFQNDPAARRDQLADFQAAFLKADLPATLSRRAAALVKQFQEKFPGRDIRIRSSSDSEDLQGFNGAGLFDSFTFHFKNADKPGKTFADVLKKVFASVWNERAYSEFDFYRIVPKSVDMGELIMPNTEGEIANGVVRWGGAIPGWDTITINAQVGDNLVTNPEGGATPDAIVVGNYGFNGEAEIQYEARSNQKLADGRTSVLTDGEIHVLFKAMKVIQDHFAKLYGREGDPTFSIECEFKIQADGKLLIKQARPWVG